MTVGFLMALVVIVGGFLWDRRGDRAAFERERQRERAAIAEERLNWMRERASLLNRIEPATAQPVDDGTPDGPMPQPAANENEWWKQLEDFERLEAAYTEPAG